jgi:uncharacterized membrane protein YecN with MAPEG domain
MVPTIVPGYAAILALIFIALSVRVIRLRRSTRVPVGTGRNAELERAVRVHGNFAEYVPLALLLLAFAEMQGFRGWSIHLLCLALLAGRSVHAYGLSRQNEDFRLRVAGMATTFTVVGLTSAMLLLRASRIL